MKKNIPIICELLLLVSFTLFAQDDSPFPKPVRGPERSKLAFLVGSFTTETHIMPGPMASDGATGKGTSVLAWGVDSMFVILDDQSVNTMMGNYKAHGVLGYDMRDNKYVLSMFNNFGDNPQYHGTLSGDTLTMTSKIQFPGGSFDQKLVWYKQGNLNQLKIFNDMGNGFVLVIDQTATPSVSAKKEK